MDSSNSQILNKLTMNERRATPPVKILISLALLAVLILIGIYFWKSYVENERSLSVAFAFDTAAAGKLFSYDETREAAYSPVTQTANGREYFVKGFCEAGSNQRYYLLIDPETGTTELFEQSGDHITQRSNSATVKTGLSCNKVSGSAVFLESRAKGAEPVQVTVWSGTDEREILTPFIANSAYLLEKGSSVLLIHEGTVSVAAIEGTEFEQILEDVLPEHVAVNGGGKEISTFNRLTMQVDTFELVQGGQPSYKASSEKLSSEPVFIQYLGEELYGIFRTETFKNGFSVQNLLNSSKQARTYVPFSPIHFPTAITTWYE